MRGKKFSERGGLEAVTFTSFRRFAQASKFFLVGSLKAM